MLDLPYSLVIEATFNPVFFAFYSPDLMGFTGAGNSVEDCIYRGRWGMEDYVAMLGELDLPVPPAAKDPKIAAQNSKIPPYAWLSRIIFR